MLHARVQALDCERLSSTEAGVICMGPVGRLRLDVLDQASATMLSPSPTGVSSETESSDQAEQLTDALARETGILRDLLDRSGRG